MPPASPTVPGRILGPAVAVWTFLSAFTRAAGAYDANVEASLDLQYYSVGSPFGDPVLLRRRYTSTLGLDLDNLQGQFDPREPSVRFRSRMRVDADFGVHGVERDPASRRYVPGLSDAPVDLMYAFVEGDGFFDGMVGFRVGRQYLIDSLGFWSFDGALARLALPIHVELSGFAGVEQRTGLPMLATPRFTADGVWRGERSDLELAEYPGFLDDSAFAPAAGATIATHGVRNLRAELAYRIVQSRSSVVVSPFLDESGRLSKIGETRTASERAGAALQAGSDHLGAVSLGGVYDLFVGAVSRANAALDWYVTPELTVGASVDYDLPTYDADSIFNWFSHGPTTHGEGRLTLVAGRAFDAGFSFGARVFETELEPVDAALRASGGGVEIETAHRTDVLAALRGNYRFGSARLGLAALGERGEGGHRVGGDLTASNSYLGGRYVTHALLSLYDWSDELRSSRDATSFTYVLGGSMAPVSLFANSRLGVEWEHSMNRLVGQRFRMLFTLDLTVLR
jgi:hypothetical protein